jgi:hypothetical protein
VPRTRILWAQHRKRRLSAGAALPFPAAPSPPASHGGPRQVGAPGTREQYVQRLGRTGRAGRGGAGRLLLCDFEKAFLLHLRDLPVRTAALPLEESEEAAGLLRAAAGRVDEELAAQTYRAWLVMGNGVRKALKCAPPPPPPLCSPSSRCAHASLGPGGGQAMPCGAARCTRRSLISSHLRARPATGGRGRTW